MRFSNLSLKSILSFLKLLNNSSILFTSLENNPSTVSLSPNIFIKLSFRESILFSKSSLSFRILFSSSDDLFIDSFTAFFIISISLFKADILLLIFLSI